MSDEKKSQQAQLNYIETYIKERRSRYTDEAIIQKLQDAGYDLEIILSVLDKYPAQYRFGQNISSTRQDTDWNPLGCLFFFPLMPMLVYFLMILNANLAGFAILVVFLLGIFLPMTIRENYPSIAKGMDYGFRTLLVLFVVLPAVGACVLWGICVVNGGY